MIQRARSCRATPAAGPEPLESWSNSSAGCNWRRECASSFPTNCWKPSPPSAATGAKKPEDAAWDGLSVNAPKARRAAADILNIIWDRIGNWRA